MRSKANIKGHPLHPILVSFPVAFFSGALVFDLLHVIAGQPFYSNIAKYLVIAGLLTALAAAIPGFIDFLFTVPPKSSAKKRAAKHGLTNVGVLLFFGLSLLYRTRVPEPDISLILGLETIGIVLLVFAGWMGGTLVYRNQIGVDPRYAQAGKWKEHYVTPVNGLAEIEDAAALKTDQMMLVHTDGRRIVIAKTTTGYAAFEDHCSHRGGSLAGGAMICGTVQCPWHGSQFDVNTGEVKAGPAKEKIMVYPLLESNGKVYIQLP